MPITVDTAMTAHEASSSSSSKSKLWKYDVFLSFRGKDTRYGFTSHLHAGLEARGYRVFIDEDDLQRGEEIKEKPFRAIEESRISVIIFSKMYADSSWCLDELVKIMECRDKLGRHVLPIFYHVDPSHVRKQDGDLAEAFQNHENDIREEKDDKKREAKQERLKLWREDLTKAANLSGHHLEIANNRKRRREAHTEATNLSDHQATGNGGEAEFIKKIIDEVICERHKIMHESLREMARAIISEKSPSYSGKWSRLRDPREVTDVPTNKSDDGHSWAALQDRISNLPQEVLVHIVSLLPLKEAAATSILSRRWRHVWAFTTTLSFDPVNFEVGDAMNCFFGLEEHVKDRERRFYVEWVDHVLCQHRGQCIERFRVCFFLQRDSAGTIDNWIQFAKEKRVQILELELGANLITFGDDDYTFPHKLLLGPEKQKVLFSSLRPCGLRVVHFKHVGMTGDAVEFLLSNCPVLERLSLSFATGLGKLRVIGPSIALKYLEIKYCPDLTFIEISGANIVSFIYYGLIIDLSLNNVPLLVEVSIYKLGTFAEIIRLAFSQLSCCLSHLETLKLDIRKAVYNQNQAFPALSNLKHLELLVDADYCLSLGRLASFMKAAPDLRSLVLGLEFGTSNEDKAILETVSKQPHHCLKVVEIAGYRGHRSCVKHVRYLVKNAVALEKIIINPVRFWCWPKETEINCPLENEEANARDHAIQHLKKKVPASVEFVCL